MTSDFTELASRLDRLERENRRLRRIVLAALLAAAPIAVMGQVQPGPNPIVESRHFVLLDANNHARASLEMAGRNPSLAFYDARGKLRVRLGLDWMGEPTLKAILPSGRDIELLSEWPRVRPLTEPHDLGR